MGNDGKLHRLPYKSASSLQVIQFGRFLFVSLCSRTSTRTAVPGDSVSYAFFKMTISKRPFSAITSLHCRISSKVKEEDTQWH